MKINSIIGHNEMCFSTVNLNYLKKFDKLNKHYQFLNIMHKIFNSSKRKCETEVVHEQICHVEEFDVQSFSINNITIKNYERFIS